MYCQLCRKQIGPLRRLFDSKYCSSDHRRRHRVNSARALREAVDYYFAEYEDDEVWPPASRENEKPKGKSLGPTETALLGLMAVGFLLLAIVGVPGGVTTSSGPAVDYAAPSHGMFEGIRSAMPNLTGAVRLQEDFHNGLGDWVGAHSGSGDWSYQSGFVRPGRLRLWSKSMSLSDYQLEFQAQIERKSVGWAFRAVDSDNFYATKITVTQPGPLPRADLIRYIVLGGHERERVELPLPMAVRDDTLYQVKVAVKGDRFSTSVNDQMVDTWTDTRLGKGGVGFFSDKGETASIRWVRIAERDSSLLGRIFSPAFILGPLPIE